MIYSSGNLENDHFFVRPEEPTSFLAILGSDTESDVFWGSPVPETLKSDMILSWQLFLQTSPNVNYYLVDHYFWSWSLLSLLHIVASSWSWLPVEFQRARETYRKRACFYAWFKEMIFCLVFWWSICWGAKGFHKCGHLATQHPFENRFSH